jgi:PAS domain S-box-containing protein
MANNSAMDAKQTEASLLSAQFSELRKVAEQRVEEKCPESGQFTDQLQHELNVHHIELELQNEALRQAQAELIESRDRYLDLYDFAPVGYLSTSSTGIIDAVNLRFAEWLGVARASLIGMPLSVFIQPDQKDRWYLILKNSLRHERQEIAEIGFKDGEGRHFFARLDCLSIKNNNDQTTIRISIVNLGAISAIQAQALESERQYKMLFDGMRDAFALVDMFGHLIRFNQPFQELLGYSAEELKKKTYQDLTPEKWHQMEAQIIEQQVLRDGESAVYEKEYRHKNGSLIPVELKTVLLNNAEGSPEGMWAVVRDISSRKQAEAALIESESRYRLAMKAIAGFVYDYDLAKDSLVVTEGYEGLLGHSLNSTVTIWDWCQQYIHPDDYAKLKIDVSNVINAEPKRFNAIFRVQHQDGHWLSVATQTLIVYDQNARPIRIVGGLSNITRRVAAETALRTLNDSLEEMVVERNAELHNRVQQLHESERFIRATLDGIPSALAVVEVGGKIIFRNKNWLDINPHSKDGGLQEERYSPYCCTCPAAAECPSQNKLKTALESALNGKRRSVSMEYACKMDAGLNKPRWIATRISLFKGEGPLRLVLAHDDISERKHAANAVSQTAKNFKAMLRKMELIQQEHSKQIAREVHDQLGSTLTMLKLGLATIQPQQELSTELQSKVTSLLELANLALQSVKRVTASLRPSMLDTLGFSAAVTWHAKEFARMSGIEIEVLLPDFVRLSVEDSETSFRIIQEALTNVAKHAKASKVMITATKSKRTLDISVCDNGIGLDTNSLQRKNSFGVIGMQERAKRLHGSLYFDRQATGGSCLRLKIPLKAKSE